MDIVFKNPNDVIKKLELENYLINDKIATSVFLACSLNKPLLVEGPAGVGKTELGKAIAHATDGNLIRLQCYEGLDEAKALYEWNYQKQLLYILSMHKTEGVLWKDIKESIYEPDFIFERPLLKAFLSDKPTILLIDEIDKSDDEFESFLLEALSEYQISIPEYGVIKAKSCPFVLLTSNNQRQLSDALKRRCLYLYIDFPDIETEVAILTLRVPELKRELACKLVAYVQTLRKLDLRKAPSIAETIDWAKAIIALGKDDLDKETIQKTINLLVKYYQDLKKVERKILS